MTRLYCPTHLNSNNEIVLTPDQVHYLFHVLRFQPGQFINMFNGNDGEWLGKINHLTKNKGSIIVLEQVKSAQPLPAVKLVFTPLKHEPLLYLIEKATELGVTELQPTLTERCNIHRLNHEKLERNTLEAAQQCERLCVPLLHLIKPLRQLLAAWDPEEALIVCRERQAVQSITTVLQQKVEKRCAFLIGPEGGFSDEELQYLSTHKFVYFCHLGPRILRAETAAIATLTSYQLLKGDWQDT